MRHLLGTTALTILALATCWVATAQTTQRGATVPQFLFTNDDMLGPNQIEGFAVSPRTGALTALPGSPYTTAGNGIGGIWDSIPQIAWTPDGNFLYVSNSGTNDISVFHVDPTTGIPSIVGQPVPTTGLAGYYAIGLGVAPDGRHLFTVNGGSGNVSVFSIDPSTGNLTMMGEPFALAGIPQSLKMAPDGDFLLVSIFPNPKPLLQVLGFDATTGTLVNMPGSPYVMHGNAAGIDTNCAGTLVYVGDTSSTNGTIESYAFNSAAGTLTRIKGSPYQAQNVRGSSNLMVSTNDHLLYVTNQGSGTIASFRLLPTGRLSEIDGSPFPDGLTTSVPGQLSTVPNGHYIFTGNFNPYYADNGSVHVYQTAPLGTLSEIAGSPFLTADGSAPYSVMAVPAKVCP